MIPMSFIFWGVPWDVSRGMVNSLGDAAHCSVSVTAARRTGDYPRLYLPAAGWDSQLSRMPSLLPGIEKAKFPFQVCAEWFVLGAHRSKAAPTFFCPCTQHSCKMQPLPLSPKPMSQATR